VTTILSYGAGTNSTGQLCAMVRHGMPAPHAILFADTGDGLTVLDDGRIVVKNDWSRFGEKPHTYTYIAMFSEWLFEHGYPRITVVRNGGKDETLEENCIRRKALPAVAYGFKTCSQRYKIEPQDKWCNNDAACRATWKAGGRVTKLIGYHADEPWRAIPSPDPKYDNRYLLIEWGMGDEECAAEITAAGLPLPGKSACFFCPNSEGEEVNLLAVNYPELADRALFMESNADLTDIAGLGRSWSWKDCLAQFDMFPDTFKQNRDMPCGCYDGAA
jgi:hypothetical protein